MTNEKESNEVNWWNSEEFTKFIAGQEPWSTPDLHKIVAEATRKGEVKAWAEAKRIVEEQGDICETANILPPTEEARRSGMASGAKGVVTLLVRKIDAKLKSLT